MFSDERENPRHDLPCWNSEDGCGGSSCTSIFMTPEPHLWCFKCEKGTWDEDLVTEWQGKRLETMANGSNVYKIEQQRTNEKHFPKRGVITALDERGITKETAEKYNVEKIFNSDGETPIGYSYPGYNKDGDLVAQKLKQIGGKKKLKWLGNHSKSLMFGQRAFPSGGKYLTITEGEEDAMACYQMMQNHYKGAFETPCISVKDGVGGALRDFKDNWEYVNSFETIILCFDGDKIGQETAEKVAKLFPYKVKIVNFPDTKSVVDENTGEKKYEWKDASDYLKNGKQKEFMNLWFKAEKYAPKGVLSFKSLWDDMTKEDSQTCVPYPWAGLQSKLHGLRTGELLMVKAPPKIGKTQLMRELIYHIRDTTEFNCGAIFLEETKKRIGIGMCAIHMNKPIQHPDTEYSVDELKEAHEYLSEENRIMIFDPQDERTVENIFSKIMYFAKAHDCKYIFLDHISMLAYKNEGFDERRFLDKLCAELKEATNSMDIGIVAVTHVNDDGKTRGSRASVQLCDALIALERDKLNDDEIKANTTHIIVEENRITGESGLASSLYYDPETGRMRELDLDLTLGERDVEFDDD